MREADVTFSMNEIFQKIQDTMIIEMPQLKEVFKICQPHMAEFGNSIFPILVDLFQIKKAKFEVNPYATKETVGVEPEITLCDVMVEDAEEIIYKYSKNKDIKYHFEQLREKIGDELINFLCELNQQDRK